MLPGPIAYAKDTESLIIANSNLEVEAYTLQQMKLYTNNNDLEGQKKLIANNKKLEPNWVSNIGE